MVTRKEASFRRNLGVGVCLGEAASLFGLWGSVRSKSEGEGSEVLLEACMSKGTKAEMAEAEDS
jgi:hypothetical protein